MAREQVDDPDGFEELDKSAPAALLIKTYGIYWDPDLVNWNGPKQLLGTFRATQREPEINLYSQKGVYVLYKDFLPVYVGRAFREPLGERLRKHSRSWGKGPRWDRFSWFGVVAVVKKSGKNPKMSTSSRLQTPALIATLEALLIMAIKPSLNSRTEKFKGAIRIYQPPRPPATNELLEIKKMLSQLIERNDKLGTSRKKS